MSGLASLHNRQQKKQSRLYTFTPDKKRGVIAQLLEELPETVDVPELLVEKGRVLDNFYIPSRYPNGHSTGAPFEHYGPLQSEVAIRHAREIIAFARAQMAGRANR
jgi:HEPN domain-containing protein